MAQGRDGSRALTQDEIAAIDAVADYAATVDSSAKMPSILKEMARNGKIVVDLNMGTITVDGVDYFVLGRVQPLSPDTIYLNGKLFTEASWFRLGNVVTEELVHTVQFSGFSGKINVADHALGGFTALISEAIGNEGALYRYVAGDNKYDIQAKEISNRFFPGK